MPFFKKRPSAGITLFNSATKQKELFVPLRVGKVRMYTCGPTVYDYVHIGNLRSFVFSDIVRRVFEYAGYDVRQVINITDFGHLVDDADDAEDKMTQALKREGKELTMENMFDVANIYIQAFKDDLREMNIQFPNVMPRASEHVQGMIAYVQALLDKGFAYTTSDGVYFETKHFPGYGVLGGLASSDHSRIAENKEKKDPKDFALWKFNDHLGWDAPWGKGFPGWHIECTAMSTRYLGKTFDIHTGGIDLKTTHHNNELAQAKGANNRPLTRYWLHHEFIDLENVKISKSLGNTVTLKQLVDEGISPLAYRYWLLTGHYRQKMNFTWDAVRASQTALHRAWRTCIELKGRGSVVAVYREEFEKALYDDFNTAEAVAVLWKLLKDDSISSGDKKTTILHMDTVLGIGFGTAVSRIEKLKLSVVEEKEIPNVIQELLNERERARTERNFAKADEIRREIDTHGYKVEDSPAGPVVKRI